MGTNQQFRKEGRKVMVFHERAKDKVYEFPNSGDKYLSLGNGQVVSQSKRSQERSERRRNRKYK